MKLKPKKVAGWALVGVLVTGGIVAETAPEAHAVSMRVTVRRDSQQYLTGVDQSRSYIVQPGSTRYILRRPPRYVAIPPHADLVWNPRGIGIWRWRNKTDQVKWREVGWRSIVEVKIILNTS